MSAAASGGNNTWRSNKPSTRFRAAVNRDNVVLYELRCLAKAERAGSSRANTPSMTTNGNGDWR